MGKKVLIVDDSRTIRQQLNFTLSKSGFHVVEAIDGLDGIEKLKENPDTVLIVTDLNMPNLNGIDMVKKIKASAELAQPPILMLTTERGSEVIWQAKQAGISGWLTKPFKPEVLVEALKKMIQ